MPTQEVHTQSYTRYDNHYTLQVSFIITSPKDNIQYVYKRGSQERKISRVKEEKSRADQPAHSDTLGPLWMAPLRSKPQNLNMQIQRIKTYKQ